MKKVIAILDAEGDTVRIFGYGQYVGDEVPPKGVKFFGMDLHDIGRANPKIVLDNGKVVWGCQCWWGDVEKAQKEIIKDRKVVVVDIDEYLKE